MSRWTFIFKNLPSMILEANITAVEEKVQRYLTLIRWKISSPDNGGVAVDTPYLLIHL